MTFFGLYADVNYVAVQKEIYDQTRVKRPCSAYILYIKDFMDKNLQHYDNVKDAMRAGELMGDARL